MTAPGPASKPRPGGGLEFRQFLDPRRAPADLRYGHLVSRRITQFQPRITDLAHAWQKPVQLEPTLSVTLDVMRENSHRGVVSDLQVPAENTHGTIAFKLKRTPFLKPTPAGGSPIIIPERSAVCVTRSVISIRPMLPSRVS